jgi:hypothetical protein
MAQSASWREEGFFAASASSMARLDVRLRLGLDGVQLLGGRVAVLDRGGGG